MTNQEISNLTVESLRDWFKKEKWVRISSSGKIAGPCGTSKNKKNPDRCLPKAKAQSLSKGERAATAAKKKRAGKKGKTVVKNTKKATVKKETKEAPAGHYFTKSGNLVKGRMSKDAKERGARKSDPKDKQRSKVPKATQYTETANPQDGKAAPYGSGYKPIKMKKEEYKGKHQGSNYKWPMSQATKDRKEADKFAGSDPKGGSTIKGTGFDWKKQTKEDVRNLVVGTLAEMQQNENLLQEDDRCTRLAKQKYDTWPSAYASGAVVRCRRGEIWKKK